MNVSTSVAFYNFSFLITKVSILSGSHNEGRDAEKQFVSFDLQLLPSDCLKY